MKMEMLSFAELHAKLLLCIYFIAFISEGSVAHGWRRGHVYPTRVITSFVSNNHSRVANLHSPERLMASRHELKRTQHTRINNSLNNDDSPTDATNNDIIEEMDTPFDDDPDGVPLFDTNERAATLFGLEPNADVDTVDSGLVFTGPIILFFSIYLTLSLFFSDDMPPLDLSM